MYFTTNPSACDCADEELSPKSLKFDFVMQIIIIKQDFMYYINNIESEF